MHHQAICQCVQHLKNLEIWLDQAERYAIAKKFDVNVLMGSRLAPDMLDFANQVRAACEYVEAGAASLAGQSVSEFRETDLTIEYVRHRLRRAIELSESVAPSLYADADRRKIPVSWAKGRVVAGGNYLLQVIIPNVFFHVVTAYAILRHNGVDIGKMDFLGRIDFELPKRNSVAPMS